MKDLRDRLRSMCDALPSEGAITLTKSALLEILGLNEEAYAAAAQQRDMTTDEVADTYGVTVGTVLRWIHCGRLGKEGEDWYRLGKRYYIRPETLVRGSDPDRRGKGSLRLPRRAAG